MSHSTKKLDLTGQRFARLTVLGPVSNIGNKTAWRCRCDWKKAESEQHGAFLADYDAGKYDLPEPQNAVAAL